MAKKVIVTHLRAHKEVVMRDYYRDGFDNGYGRPINNYERDYPKNDGDHYSYQRGLEDGIRRRRISDELDREQFGDDG